MVTGLNCSDFNNKLQVQNVKVILNEYKSLIGEFIVHISESVTLHDKQYFEFIIKRGLDTLMHCFKMLLLYTKHIGIVSYYCKKALCYYVEFIGQIAQDSNSYLQLNTKDATLFVYKKTIFEIDGDFRKNYVFNIDEKEIFELITLNAEILNSLMINQLKIQKKNKIDKDFITNTINVTMQCFDKLEINCSNIKNNKTILFFINNIMLSGEDSIKYIETCETFIKKIKRKTIKIPQLTKIFYMDVCKERYESLTTLKFINWIFQQST
jgi:hypothetical protein